MRRRTQKIRTTPDGPKDGITIGGWLSGRNTYLWIGDKDQNFLGTIGGRKLYRLAKAIVRTYESDGMQ